MSDAIPSPGSDAALEQGCTCPMFDNAHGKGIPMDGGTFFWASVDCPLHKHRTTKRPELCSVKAVSDTSIDDASDSPPD